MSIGSRWVAGTDPLDTRGQGLGNDRHLTIFDHRPHLRVPRQGSGRRSRAAEREAVERMLEDVARLQAVRLQQSLRLGIGVDPTTSVTIQPRAARSGAAA